MQHEQTVDRGAAGRDETSLLTPGQKQAAAKIATDAGYLEWCEECPGYRTRNRVSQDPGLEMLLAFGKAQIARRANPYPDFGGDPAALGRALHAVIEEAAEVECPHRHPEHQQPSM
jgi:hypothetical protein